jgi:hypothetical protein
MNGADAKDTRGSIWHNGLWLSTWSIVAAFGAYACMYAFRKPFKAATFSDVTFLGIGYKPVLVAAQVFGYSLSKFLGIKIVSEMKPHRRAMLILILIGSAEGALLLFGLTPPPYNLIWLFANGLPLGMVFGLVLGFLEGRRQTEALAAGLCTSFIIADGYATTVGAYLVKGGVSEFWMPFVAGLMFVPPLLLFVWMLARIPAPTSADVEARSERVPMQRADRWRFFGRYAVGLVLLVLIYLLVTVLRSIRSDFAPEIWRGLGVSDEPEVFAESETIVGIAVAILIGLAVFIRNNRRAFFTSLALSGGGFLVLLAALVGQQAGRLSPLGFMVLYGLGLYVPYVAVQTTIFERLIAMTRDPANIGYLVYLADSVGYLGYVVVMLAKYSIGGGAGFLDFFVNTSWVLAAGCIVMLIPCWRYFATRQSVEPEVVKL